MDDVKRPTTMTRDALYTLVWSTPMTKAAAGFGISGNGLAKICDRLDVPYPPRGYWAKKAAGKPVVTFRLPERKAETPNSVTISPSVPVAKSPLIDAVAQDAALAAQQNALDVPDRLIRPHQVIARWIDRRRERYLESKQRGWGGHLHPKDFSNSEQRQHRILNTFFKALEQRGFKIQQGERQRLEAKFEGETISFQIREKQKQTRRPLTPDESKYAWHREKGYVQELKPSGILAFSITTYLPSGLKREWIEKGSRTLESQLPEIVATFVAAGPALIEQTKQRKEAEVLRREAEHRRYEEQQRRKQDDNRWRRFVEMSQTWRELELAGHFLSELRAQNIDPEAQIDGRSVQDWIAWAQMQLTNRDLVAAGPKRIFEDIASVTSWTYRD